MMRKFLSWPIRVHLLLLVILLALPSITLILYWGIAARDEAIEDAKDECLKFVNAVAGEQQAVVAGVQHLLSTLALLPQVQSRNAPATDAILSDLLKKNPLYSSIGISDISGLIWASATPYEGTISVADRKYFRDAVQSGMFSSGEFSVGRIVKKPVLNFAQPVMNASNELTSVIAMSVNLDHVQSLFEKINLPAGSSYSLLDHRGIILYRNSQDAFSEQLVGKPDTREELFKIMVEGPDEGTYEAMGNDGQVRLTAYKKLRLPHESQPYLYIRSSIPKATVVSKANAAMLRNMAALASVFAVGLILAAFIGRRMILDPIEKLKEASRQMATGPAPVNISEQVKHGELGELAQAFDDMTEALLRKEEELLESERRERERAEELATMLEAVPTPVIIVHDPDSTHMTGNLAADGLLRHPRGAEISLSAPDEVKPSHFRAIKDGRELGLDELPAQRAARGEHVKDFEFSLVFDDGATRHLLGYGTPLLDKGGHTRGAVHVLVDITERKQAEEALQAANDELEKRVKERTYELYEESLYARSLIEASLDPLVTISIDGKITDVNRASEEATGVSRDQLVGSDFSDYFTEQEKARAGYEEVFRRGFVRDYPLELKSRDGHVTPVLYNASVYRDETGQIMGVFAAARDITERKQAEAALRKLASELVMAEERERKRIAGVLHDEVAQTLAAAKMRIDMLQLIPFDQEDKQTLKDARGLLLQSIQETRALMTDIGNPLLSDLGLQAACEELANRLMDKHPLRISCNIQDAYRHLNPDVKTILYQLIRELLNNVVKHSHAANANVIIDMENGYFRVKVTDDGVGFDPQILGAPTIEGGFGLYSIRERLLAVNGSLRIESTPGRGTVVTAILPAALD
jgi:PAS domain S-box-containing protein